MLNISFCMTKLKKGRLFISTSAWMRLVLFRFNDAKKSCISCFFKPLFSMFSIGLLLQISSGFAFFLTFPAHQTPFKRKFRVFFKPGPYF